MAVKDTSVLYSAKGRIIVDTDRKDEYIEAGYSEKEITPKKKATPVADEDTEDILSAKVKK